MLVWAEEETIPASAVRQPKEQRLLEFPQTLVYSLLNISLLASPRYLWAQRLGTPAPDRGHDKKKVYSGTLCKRWQTQYIKEASSCGVILYDKNGLFERFQTWSFFLFLRGGVRLRNCQKIKILLNSTHLCSTLSYLQNKSSTKEWNNFTHWTLWVAGWTLFDRQLKMENSTNQHT